MNKTLLASMIAASFALTACNEQKAEPAKTAAVAEKPALQSNIEKVSYGIGLNIAQTFVQQKLDINRAALEQGLNDGLTGNEPALEKEVIMAAMQEFQKQQMEAQQAERKTLEDSNATEATAFFAENGAKESVVTTESGLQYKIITDTDGASPAATDAVVVHY